MENKQFDFHEIKTFEDAFKRLNISKETCLSLLYAVDKEAFLQANALYKLLIIQKAINNGKHCNENGFSYSPYWMFYTNEDIACLQSFGIRSIISRAVAPDTVFSGARFAGVYTRRGLILSDGGFPLRFNSRKAAVYAAKQFEDLFLNYYGFKVKD